MDEYIHGFYVIYPLYSKDFIKLSGYKSNTCFPSLFIIDRSTIILSVLGKLGEPRCCCSARYLNSRSRWSDCSRSRQTTIKTSISISPIYILLLLVNYIMSLHAGQLLASLLQFIKQS